VLWPGFVRPRGPHSLPLRRIQGRAPDEHVDKADGFMS